MRATRESGSAAGSAARAEKPPPWRAERRPCAERHAARTKTVAPLGAPPPRVRGARKGKTKDGPPRARQRTGAMTHVRCLKFESARVRKRKAERQTLFPSPAEGRGLSAPVAALCELTPPTTARSLPRQSSAPAYRRRPGPPPAAAWRARRRRCAAARSGVPPAWSTSI